MKQSIIDQVISDIKAIKSIVKTLDLSSGDAYGMFDSQVMQCLKKACQTEDEGLLELSKVWESAADLYYVEAIKLLETERVKKHA